MPHKQARNKSVSEIILTDFRLKLLRTHPYKTSLRSNFRTPNRESMRIFLAIILCGSIGLTYAQTSDKYTPLYAQFHRAEELFLKDQFAAAREIFHEVHTSIGDPTHPYYVQARYYEGLSALELYQNDGVDLLLAFAKEFPESIYSKTIAWKLGNYYYQKKKYEDALEWYKQLNPRDLDSGEMETYYFKKGYAHFELEQWTEARSAFVEIKDSPLQYGTPALYYFSHIEYIFGNYQTALDGFEILARDERFSRVAPYYVIQIYYLQGRYSEVTQYGPNIMDSVPRKYELELKLLVGDAFFKKGDYKSALPYLADYNRRVSTSIEMDYQLGFAYFKEGYYKEAIPYLDRATKRDDELAQKAFYQIGECYMNLDKIDVSRSAFEQAHLLDFDEGLSEDALYHYAVLSYKLDINPYNEAVNALELYLNRYPNSSRKEDIYSYLINVYATTNKYEKALASMDALPHLDIRLKSIYQVVAFNAGVEQFQKNNPEGAIRYFSMAQKNPIDQKLAGKGRFWSADAHFVQGNYAKAIAAYRQFISLPGGNRDLVSDAYYNIGYAYLNLNDTTQAIENFRLFTQQTVPNKNQLADGWMRIGDGYYATRSNEEAIKAYKEVLKIKRGYEDQALFYMGKTYGYMNKIPEKVDAHQQILQRHPTSKYVRLSILEIAESYKGNGQFKQALDYYTRYTTSYPESDKVKEAELQIADIHYKQKDYAVAEQLFLDVLEKYPNDREVCLAGGKGLVAIYTAQRTPEKIAAVSAKHPCAKVDSDEEEDVFYATAYEPYNDSNYAEALVQIDKYLDRYPNGKYLNELTFFKANSLWATKDTSRAVEVYELFLSRPNNGYTEFAAIRMSKYFYNNGEYERAYPYYQRLEKLSSDPEVIYNARLGMMRTAFLTERWEDAATYGKKLLDNGELKPQIELEAHYANGFSNLSLKNYDEAMSSLLWLSKNTTTVRGAEAQFAIADIHFARMEFEKCEKEINALLKRKPTYNYWVAKGLILQAKKAMALSDYFQAEQTLKSVIEHYPIQDDGVLMEANEVWDELMQIKNAPKDVEEVPTPVIEINEEEGGQ